MSSVLSLPRVDLPHAETYPATFGDLPQPLELPWRLNQLHVGPDRLSLAVRGLASMEYTFTPVRQGTLYENNLILGGSSWWGPAAMRMLTPRGHGEVWVKHNIEEVGAFEESLPALYYRETGRRF